MTYTEESTFDLTIIGGGPGGYTSAIRAAQLGSRVALVEEKKLGGVCLNVGCIPAKSLLYSLKILSLVKKASEFGVKVEGVKPDFKAMMNRKKATVERMVKGVEDLLKANRVHIVYGRGRLLSPSTVEVETTEGRVKIESRTVIIATGSRPAIPPIPGVEEAVTTEDILELKHIPNRVLIIGAGPEGVEFATILNDLGAKVTLTEALRTPLPLEDHEVGAFTSRALSRRGIEVKVETQVKEISKADRLKTITLQDDERESRVEADYVVLAAGRRPNSENLRLKDLHIEMKDGWIVVDEHMETSVEGVYAVGDIVGGGFVHVAAAQGTVAAENALGLESIYDGRVVPRCIYMRPEVAAVGLTEREAEEKGYTVNISRAPMNVNSKADLTGETEGFVKIVAEASTREVLGVHITGEDASEIISEASLLIKLRATVDDLAATVHPYPAFSEALKEAALNLTDRIMKS